MKFSKFVSLKGIFFGLRFKDFFSALSLQGSLTAANYKMNEMRRWTVKSKAQLPDLSPQFFVCPNLLLLFPKPVLPVSLDRHGRSSHCLSLLCYSLAEAASWPKQPLAAAMAAPAIYIISGTYNSAVRPCSWFGSLPVIVVDQKRFPISVPLKLSLPMSSSGNCLFKPLSMRLVTCSRGRA